MKSEISRDRFTDFKTGYTTSQISNLIDAAAMQLFCQKRRSILTFSYTKLRTLHDGPGLDQIK